MDSDSREIIKIYIYANIKILENKKKSFKEKRISTNNIVEEANFLIKDYKHLMRLYKENKASVKDIYSYRSDINEILDYLESYLFRKPRFNSEIYKVYKKLLFLI